MSDLNKASQVRQQMSETAGQLASTIQATLAERGPLVKGLFQMHGTRCGQPNCSCVKGQLHRTAVLVVNQKGKRRNIYVPIPDRPEIQLRSQRYRRLRQARAEIVKLSAETLRLIDDLVDALSESYVPEPRRKRCSKSQTVKKRKR